MTSACRVDRDHAREGSDPEKEREMVASGERVRQWRQYEEKHISKDENTSIAAARRRDIDFRFHAPTNIRDNPPPSPLLKEGT